MEFLTQLEIQIEREELKKMGLTDEEIEGYVEFFIENYPELLKNDK